MQGRRRLLITGEEETVAQKLRYQNLYFITDINPLN
jgi:hypothetical protein